MSKAETAKVIAALEHVRLQIDAEISKLAMEDIRATREEYRDEGVIWDESGFSSGAGVGSGYDPASAEFVKAAY